jgi:hypothetical protein
MIPLNFLRGDPGVQGAVLQLRGIEILQQRITRPQRFIKDGLNGAFKFRNPNVKGECGCGESFSV